MYQPNEDSYLILKHIRRYAKGIVLDMGTGTGLLALEAARLKKVVRVYALDIDPQAISDCRSMISHKKIVFLRSNLFQVFRGDKRYEGLKFDTMIFNPPYLPDDPNLPDKALDGGKKGHELICRFLNQAGRYLKPKTKILLVFSSLTSKLTLENYFRKKGFSFRQIDHQHISFEDIYLYLLENED